MSVGRGEPWHVSQDLIDFFGSVADLLIEAILEAFVQDLDSADRLALDAWFVRVDIAAVPEEVLTLLAGESLPAGREPSLNEGRDYADSLISGDLVVFFLPLACFVFEGRREV